ncbi:MAG: F-type H+/Na+-transporting ATPase subunit alpha, partial [Sphingomonadales bacterium]|nr:F-type H+/Na+-transporting ATPase subunit alpha [Sphingomonadales bacterium]
ARFESEFLDYLRRQHADVLTGIRESQQFDDETEKSVSGAYDSFAEQFETSEGGSIKTGSDKEDPMEDEELEQEQIVKQKRG